MNLANQVTTNLFTKDGRPSDNMTDTLWQICFRELAADTPQSDKRCLGDKSSLFRHELENETNYQRYVKYINSVLAALRRGEEDYCYYVYQIRELLKFEHDNLRTEYVPEGNCFRVWLANKFSANT